MTTMIEVTNTIRMQAHRANIDRYRKLLAGRLTRTEREYIMRRIAEERTELRRLEDGQFDETPPGPGSTVNPLAERESRAGALRWDQRL
jgi:hypothetical protein